MGSSSSGVYRKRCTEITLYKGKESKHDTDLVKENYLFTLEWMKQNRLICAWETGQIT